MLAAATLVWPQQPAPRIVLPISSRQRMRLRGNIYPLARPANDHGAAAPELPLRDMLLLLKRSPEQAAALQQLLEEQREKGSPHYRQWLTPAEFGARFGPAPADIAQITNWLAASGFTVNQVAAGRNVITFSGTALDVQAALHTAMHRYQVRGAMHLANVSDPSIPAALAPVVAGVVSLNDFRSHPTMHIIGEGHVSAAAPGEPEPGMNIPGPDGQTVHVLTPSDLTKIYNVPISPGGLDGAGVTIAIVARAYPNTSTDLTDFAAKFRQSGDFLGGGINMINAGPSSASTDPGDIGEAILDTDYAKAMAPSAALDVVVSGGSDTTDGVDLSALYIVNHNLASVVTASFGECEADMGAAENAFWSNLWQQAAAQGMTVLVSAGDGGAAGCDNPNTEAVAKNGLAVNGIASTPFDTAVGGTEFHEAGNDSVYWSPTDSPDTGYESALGYIPEEAWNESEPATSYQAAIWAGGGGASAIYAKPAWQAGTGVPGDQARDLPDVSLSAAGHDGYAVCYQGSCQTDPTGGFNFYVFSGTSAASPTLAGFLALVNQQQGSRLGLVNPVLYRLAGDTSAAAFHDVTTGSNEVPCAVGSPNCTNGEIGYPAAPGYDLATGLGSINGANLLHHWSDVSFAATTTSLSLTPPSPWTHGQSVPFSIQVSGNGNAPAPTGTVEIIAQTTGGNLPVQAFTLDAQGGVQAATALLPGGSYTAIARYAGDSNYGASVSAPQAVTVEKENSIVTFGLYAQSGNGLLTPISTLTYGDPFLVRASAAATSGFGTPSGSVSFTGLFGLGGGWLDGQGAALISGDFPDQAGNLTIQAQYGGDNSFNPAQSAPASLIVNKAPTQLTVIADAGGGGDLFRATITTTAAVGLPPSGTVNFFDETALVGSAMVDEGGTQGGHLMGAIDGFGPSNLPGASATITARYSGDSNYLSSSSAPVTVATPANFLVTPSVLNFGAVTLGGTSAVQTVTLENAGGQPANPNPFSADFLFGGSCNAVIPPGSSCQFSVSFHPLELGDRSFAETFPGGAKLQLNGAGAGFQLSFSGSNVGSGSVEPGQSLQIPLTIIPVGGWSQVVSLSCDATGVPLGACGFASSSVPLDGTDPVRDVLTITTTARPASAGAKQIPVAPWGETALAFFVLTGAILMAPGLRSRRLRSLGMLVLVGGCLACGGGGASSYVPPPSTPPPPPAATFTPSSVNFGSLPLFQQNSQSVIFKNPGPAELSVGSMILTEPGKSAPFDFSVTGQNCSTIAPNQSCDLTASFTPHSVGPVTASVSIQYSGQAPPATLSLSGTGAAVQTPTGSYDVNVKATSGGLTQTTYVVLTVQ